MPTVFPGPQALVGIPENPGPIIPASTHNIIEGATTQPNMRGALDEWYRPITMIAVTTTIVDSESREVRRPISTTGMLQPMRARAVALKPEGQRAWRWYTLHAPRDIELKPDDQVVIEEIPYRVMGRWNWSNYGFVKYELVEDYRSGK